MFNHKNDTERFLTAIERIADALERSKPPVPGVTECAESEHEWFASRGGWETCRRCGLDRGDPRDEPAGTS